MKIKKLIGVAALATTLAVGAIGISSFASSKPAEVSAATSGSLVVKFESNHNWFQSGAKICAYITNDSSSVWTSLQTTSTDTLLYKFDYTVNFTPTKLIWVRMNPSETQGSWDSGKKWNQTGDLGWTEATYIHNGWDNPTCDQWTLSAQVRSSLVPSFGTKTTLSTIGLNSDNNPEVSGKVSLEVNEEFKMLAGDGVWSGYYGRPNALVNCFSGGSLTERSDDNPNIKCLIAGTYDFYFDTETKRVWISRQDIVDADGWATYFNSNVGCDSQGVDLPSGWSNVSGQYLLLSDDAKDYVYGGKANPDGDNLGRALATYDYAVTHHSSLTKFITDHSGNVRNAAVIKAPVAFDGGNNSGAITTIVVTSVVALTAIVGYFFFRKRKVN